MDKKIKNQVWRFDIINFLINRIGATRYLEIGVEDGDSINAIKCEKKHGVDPASKNATHKLESDEFFEMLAPSVKYDIVFVDGLHVADQAERDIVNSIKHLSQGGFIIVHDCNPAKEWHQRSFEEAKKNGCREWNGDVYKAIIRLRATRNDIDVCVVDTDWGCGVIRVVPPNDKNLLKAEFTKNQDITFDWFNKNRQRLLNLKSYEDFLQWL